MTRARRAGFTLVELLACVGMLAALSALAAGVAWRAIEAGRAASCQNNLRQLVRANWAYAADHGTFVAAATDIEDGNEVRWHGVRDGSGGFAAQGGLTEYLGGAGGSGAVRRCPSFPASGTGFEASCGGYGYNAHGVGSQVCMPEPNAGTSRGLPPARLGHPATTAMFTDSAYAQGRGAEASLVEYSFCEPREWAGGGTPWPTVHFRHLGCANVAWCDGHVSRERRTATGARGAELGLGWFGADGADLFSP